MEVAFLQTSHAKSLYRRNITLLYLFQVTSHLWFDGALWVIYWEHRGLNLFVIGLLEALLHLVSLLLDIPMGILADKIGWKYSLFLSGIAGAMYCACSLLPYVTLGAFSAFVFRGVQITLANGSDMALTYETALSSGNVNHYQSLSGRLYATQILALGLAEGLGGWLAAWNWAAVYGLFTLANLLSATCSLFLSTPRRKESKASAHTLAAATPSLIDMLMTSARFASKNSAYRRWIAFSATLSGCIATFSFYGQSLLHDVGWSTQSVGILMGVECAASAIASVASATITRKLHIPGIVILTASGLALFAWLPPFCKAFGYLLSQAMGSTAEPLIDKSLNTLLPGSLRATLLSGNSTAFSLFMVAIFPLFGYVSSRSSTIQTFHWCSGLVLFGVVIGFPIWLWKQRRSAAIHHAQEKSGNCDVN